MTVTMLPSFIPESLPSPPDGGWGWVVVFSSFCAHLIVLGLQYSFGVLYRALLNDQSLAGDYGSVAWVGSLAVAMMLGSGVVIGREVHRVGHRRVAFAGAVLVPLGLLLSSFVTALPVLYLTHGVITGLGFAASFQPSVMIISRYFVKRRALATGIAVAGSGVGTLVFAAVSDALISRVGWRATLQVFSFVSLIVLTAAAAVYAPVLSVKPLVQAEKVESGLSGPVPVNVSALTSDLHQAPVSVSNDAADWDASVAFHKKGSSERAHVQVRAGLHLTDSLAEPTLANPVPSMSQTQQMSTEEGIQRQASVRTLTMLEVWQHPAFLPVAGVLFVYGGALFVTYGHLVVAAGDAGLSNDAAARLVSYVGIAGMTGRIVFGRIQDNPRVDRILLLQASLTLAGVSVLCMAFLGPGWPGARTLSLSTTEGLLVLGAFTFGLFSGAVVSQIPPLMVDYVGLDALPHAMGGQYSIQAPAVLLAPPCAGWVRKAEGNYFWVFLMTGLAMSLAPLLLLFMPRKKK